MARVLNSLAIMLVGISGILTSLSLRESNRRISALEGANGHMEYVLTTQPDGSRTWGESK